MKFYSTVLLSTLLLAATSVSTAAEAKRSGGGKYGWRVDGCGHVPSVNPPIEWDESRNVAWKTDLSDFSNASPVVFGNRLFICSEPSVLLCLDLETGKILWKADNSYQQLFGVSKADIAKATAIQNKINRISGLRGLYLQAERKLREAKNREEKQKYQGLLKQYDEELANLNASFGALEAYSMPITYPTNGYSSATPVCDGEHVYAVYGTGVVACYTLDGKKVWVKLMEKPPHRPGHPRGFSSSLCVSGNTLFVHINTLIALEKKSGEIRWKQESLSGYGSPRLIQIDGTDLILTERGDIFRVDNGEKLAGNLANFYDITANSSASPVIQGNTVYFIHRKGRAVRLPASLKPPFKAEVLWELDRQLDRDEYNATPVFHNGLLYVVSRKGTLHVLDAESGELVFKERLLTGSGRSIQPVYTSPTLAGELLYFCGKGNTLVVKPGKSFEVLQKNSLQDDFWSTPTFVGNRMLIRGKKRMYCIVEAEK